MNCKHSGISRQQSVVSGQPWPLATLLEVPSAVSLGLWPRYLRCH
ncbi:hypothetical protein BJP36_42520 [Moorena producens JHB]|uniref:Uncharacterized protein n=1 Tax=Moorena producens (strain JHB) TaxID=1454205 RepID=A0A9Q9SSX3_MOOP1|nr:MULTISPECIES: hypothetical protein [Moorena]WAN69032.1 hypothetical protein BJP36_42520 [Moorena producens JHB]